ncbi:MAG: metallophosphoesterase family protein [Desertimonas sp.]
MRIGVIADIHGNIEALSGALEQLTPTVDEVLVAGDAFSDHRFSNEVVAKIRDDTTRYVLGNHELSLLAPAGVNARTSPRVDTALLAFVADQPLQIRTRIGDKSLLMVHGSPWEPYGDYLVPGNPRFGRADELDADFVIMGHTHTAFTHRIGRTLFVNPGSLGKSDDPERRTTVTYATLDTESEEVCVHELPNPLLTSMPHGGTS